MCSGTKRKPSTMEGGEEEKREGLGYGFSVLLELSASDDHAGFKAAVEEQGHAVDEAGLWYGRRLGSKKMAFEERTPLMIAATFGSRAVASYILGTGRADVNRACGSDRATALHCAAAGASAVAAEVVELLLAAAADAGALDACGNRPGDLIAPQLNPRRRKALEVMLNGASSDDEEEEAFSLPEVRSSPPPEKREYPVDLSLPDIKNGMYSTDEFRMYTFKIKPCSRAYSHDWTECPFVHPGENARRRDPRKYHYSCVPCPEFRKGACRQGDACEYAHGIFECWLHPAQYRTRLCKDETGCQRRVCFFAHKPEELRPLYASTGSAVPSPRSFSASGMDMGAITPLALGSPSAVLMPSSSTPPVTPTGVSSPMGMNLWQNPPALQLQGSRLKAALSARDMDFDGELLGIESYRLRQHLMGDISSGISSPSGWNNGLSSAGETNRLGGMKPTNLEDIFGSQLQGLSLNATASQLQSPTGIQMRQTVNQQQQLNSSYSMGLPSSPVRASPLFGGVETSSASSAAAVLSSRAAAFAKRSQSFIERSAVNRHSGFSSPAGSGVIPSSNFSDWGSPDGKLDWGMQGEELNKLRKSASFGLRSSGGGSIGSYSAAAAAAAATAAASMPADEPDVSWVQSLVIDPQPVKTVQFNSNLEEQQQCHFDTGASPEMLPAWVEQMYMEQEQMVA